MIRADGGKLGMRALSALVAGVLVVAGCASGPGTEAGGPSQEVEQEAPFQKSLDRCEDVETVATDLEGSLGARQNPVALMEVISAYRDEHADTYGGTWIDRDSRIVVVAFTDDPDPHREAIVGLLPPANEVLIDVVQVRHTEAELKATQQELKVAMSGRDFAESIGSAVLIRRNRLGLDLINPAEETLDELAELVSDPTAVCVSVFHTPEAPEGPLQVIPDLATEDPLVTCIGIPSVRYSSLIDPPSIDDVDHPAVDALRAELEAPGPEPMARGDWVVISIGDTRATFAVIFPDEMGHAQFRGERDRWRLGSYGLGPPCQPIVVLPDGLNRVIANLDPASLPSPDSTTIDLLVTEYACASGREMGEALQGPQVVETDTEVLVAFAAEPLAAQAVNCQGNPSSRVSVELSQPLGNRTIYDGLHVPPKPLVPAVGAP